MSEQLPSLVVLDLDGTSARYEPRFELDPVVREALAAARARHPQLQWALNSDRFEGEMIRLAEYLEPEERPIAIMSCQHLLYLRDHTGGYQPQEEWNQCQRTMHQRLWKNIFPKFDGWQRDIRQRYPVHELFVCNRYFAFRVPPARITCLGRHVKGLLAPWPSAKISGNHEWLFVVHESFSKGRLLQRFSAESGIERRKILAIGDGYNDLSMLDRAVVGYTGCPNDAAAQVQDAVKATGGIVANAVGPRGTAEIITRIFNG